MATGVTILAAPLRNSMQPLPPAPAAASNNAAPIH